MPWSLSSWRSDEHASRTLSSDRHAPSSARTAPTRPRRRKDHRARNDELQLTAAECGEWRCREDDRGGPLGRCETEIALVRDPQPIERKTDREVQQRESDKIEPGRSRSPVPDREERKHDDGQEQTLVKAQVVKAHRRNARRQREP